MNKWKVITGIVLIFLLGALSGSLGTDSYLKSRIKRFVDPKGPPPPIRLLQRQLDKLALSSEQQTKVDALLEQMRTEFTDIVEKSKPELKNHFDRHVQLIRAELAPNQQDPFDETIKKIKARMSQMSGRPFRRKRPLAELPQMKAELGLTPEQALKSEAVIESMENKRREILNRYSEAKQSLHDKKNAEMKQLTEAVKKESSVFLSEAQLQGFMERIQASGRRPF